MNEHTPEPWSGQRDDNPYYCWLDIYDSDDNKIISVHLGSGIDSHDYTKRALANAERIVACVNGCAGIENPEAVGELLEAYGKLHDMLSEMIEGGEVRCASTLGVNVINSIMDQLSGPCLEAMNKAKGGKP